MTKIYLIKIFFFLTLGISAQDRPSGIKITVQENLTKFPMANKTVTITVAPLDAQIIVLDSEGSAFIDTPSGRYSVRIACEKYLGQIMNNVDVGKQKTAYVTMGLSPARKLTRKERKQFGVR